MFNGFPSPSQPAEHGGSTPCPYFVSRLRMQEYRCPRAGDSGVGQLLTCVGRASLHASYFGKLRGNDDGLDEFDYLPTTP